MADIVPFKGTLYNPEKIRDLSKVVTPPYDVISPEEQEELYNKSPYNIVRILFGKDFPDDREKENKYSRAGRFLKDWQKQGILKKDEQDNIYIYLQEFSIDGQLKRRLGFIALLKLEEFDTETSSVYPHEHTLSAPKLDRSNLIQSIEANLGPIFALFADEDNSIDAILEKELNSQPIVDIVDYQGIRNKLWRVSDRDRVEKLVQLMKGKKIFIADGHHRYEVGLEFSKSKKDPKYGYILTYFAELYADGIVILPYHRLIAGVGKDIVSGLEEDLKRDFETTSIESREGIRGFLSSLGRFEKRFVIYDGRRFIGLSVKDNDSLDVTVLHNLIIEPLEKKIEMAGEKISIDFTKDLDYAINEVNKGNFSITIILNPTLLTHVRDVAFSGRRIPQKSTYFYPKVLTGLVINVF